MPATHFNADNEAINLSGKVSSDQIRGATETSWSQRKHPSYKLYSEDEGRQRASYVATRRALAPYLVPHRFEAKEETKGENLPRAKFGYGVGLNKAYLHDIFGHIRSAPTEYWWATLGSTEDAEGVTAAPAAETVGYLLWHDATGTGITWPNFYEGEVLEWMLTSVGGFVVVDMPPGEYANLQQALAAGQRPVFRFAPMSWVWDYGVDDKGFRFIKLLEAVDDRDPQADVEQGFTYYVLLYKLLEDGTTEVGRYDMEGEEVDPPVNLGVLVTREGRPTLPLVFAGFGTHPELDFLGSGALMGLDDIVIDLFNLITEVREAYRDIAFGLFAYRGPDFEAMYNQMSDGSRMVDLGSAPESSLERVAADPGEVEAGLRLVDVAVSNWSLAAKRKAADAMADSPDARSGLSLQAEFQLDLKPLLVSITEELDAVESQCMYLAAQLMGQTPEDAMEIGVERDTEFRLEEEASRIARLVLEFMQTLPLPAEAKVQIVMRWLEHSGLMDLDAEVELEVPPETDPLTGEPQGEATMEVRVLREVLEEQARELFNAEQSGQVRQNEGTMQDMAALMAAQQGGGGGEEEPFNKQGEADMEGISNG